MIYNIKRTNGIVDWLIKAVKPTGTQNREAMGVDVADMAFTLPQYVDFRINDFVDVYGRRYKINQTPTVEKKSKRRFEYKITFEAVWYDLAKVQIQSLDPQNELLEPVFSVMGNAGTIVALIVENANRHSPGWTMGVVDDTAYENFSFSAQNCLQALHELAGKFQTELWIEGKTINLQKREQPSGLVFEQGKGNGLYTIRRELKNNANILTRLYVRGGSTNLPVGYGSVSLLLPDKETYIQDDLKVDEYGLIENTQIFSDIFPTFEGTVTAVTAGDDNWPYFVDTSLDFDLNAYKAPGLDAKVTFNTGQLAGYTFTLDSYNHATKQFKINKKDEEKSIDVPSNLYRPAVGDKYVLIDMYMPAERVTAAENKLAAAAWAYYNPNSDPLSLLQFSASCDPLFIQQNAVDIQLGNTATLLATDMGLSVELRIASYRRDLQDERKYTDVAWRDTIGANEIVRQYAQQQKTLQLIESSGLLDINQLRKSIFLNRLSESNGYLMLSGQKIKAGLADYALDSQKWNGELFAAWLNQPVRTTDDVRFKSITSTSYVSGAMGSGFKIDENGNATFDNLTVRKEFNVFELVLNKISGTNGALAVTDTIKIATVNETPTGYDCTIDTGDNTIAVPFHVNDLVRCQVWNGGGIKYYFAKVSAVNNGTFTLDKATKVGGGVPAAGDVVARFGNTTDTDRQGLMYLTASDTNAPYLDVLDGVTSDNLAGKTKVRLGRLDGITDADFGDLEGYGLYGENVYLKNGKFKGEVTVTGGNAETISGAAAKAAAAQAAAITAAAADASAKIAELNISNEDVTANIAAAQAAAEAFAQSKADIAQAAAIAAASTDAQSKATTAYSDAVTAAAAYSITVANDAASLAEIAAAADALVKANAAYNDAVLAATTQYNTLTASLKDMAYQDVVELSKLGTTVIEGGKIKTTLLDADYIKANVVNAGYINTLNLDAAAIKTGTIDAARLNATQIVSDGGGATTTALGIAQAAAITAAELDAAAKAAAAQAAATAAAALDASTKDASVATAAQAAADAAELAASNLANLAQLAADAAQSAASAANTAYSNLVASLKTMAYQDISDLAVGGQTLITGGKINTFLLDAQAIQAAVVTATYITTLELVATKVSANVGNIGSLQIDSSGFKIGDSDSWANNSNFLKISGDYLLYRKTGSSVGQVRELAFDLYSNPLGSSYTESVRITNTIANAGAFGGTNTALRLEAAAGNNNLALDVVSGITRLKGLRVGVKVISGSYYVQEDDYYILSTAGGLIYLPPNPQEGRTLVFSKTTSSTVTLNTATSIIKDRNSSPGSTHALEWTMTYTFVNGYWQLISFLP